MPHLPVNNSSSLARECLIEISRNVTSPVGNREADMSG